MKAREASKPASARAASRPSHLTFEQPAVFPSPSARAVLVINGRDYEAVEEIEGCIALPGTRIESGRRHHNKIKIGNDEDALPAETHRGYPGDFLGSGKRAAKPPLITIEEQTAEIPDCLKARHY